MQETNSLQKKLVDLEKELITISTTNDAKKLQINGAFGKLNSKWSIFFSPELLIQITLTGQLALLMLIEKLEISGFTVVSANTDGIVIKIPRDDIAAAKKIIVDWEEVTQFKTEHTEYQALYSRDVNNYIAVKTDGSVKVKGAFSFDGLSKNPTNMICNDAVINWLTLGIDPAITIKSCDDVRRFISIRQVKGGAVTSEGEHLGKAVRWYYSQQSLVDEPTCIRYIENSNLVAGSTGATPLMTLPDTVPKDIDYDWYINEANSILNDIGVTI